MRRCRYRAVYIVHVNPALPRPLMTLFLLTREAATKRAVIPLDARRPFVLNTLDNLLVVHSLGSQVRCKGLSASLCVSLSLSLCVHQAADGGNDGDTRS